ncbi:hypothetical protein RDWZM_007188 [Blomia tropicalis]|uniref:Uncharacterized protein n=1 Tax=Blomia tropicalis TaxID=40697 RepID=A0A9Q0RP46_BLOTA|nr:hypothetical protein RDWZM_007188 [Blomia tropicalis]
MMERAMGFKQLRPNWTTLKGKSAHRSSDKCRLQLESTIRRKPRWGKKRTKGRKEEKGERLKSGRRRFWHVIYTSVLTYLVYGDVH